MWRRLLALVVVVTAWPAAAGAAGWVPGFDQIAPSGSVREPVAVVTPDLRTVVTWVDGLTVRAAIRPRGGTFGEPFLVDAGSGTYVPSFLDAVALPNGEVLVAWGGPTEVHDVRVRTVKPDGTVGVARPDVFGGVSAIGANAAGTVAVAYFGGSELLLAIRPAGSATFDPPVSLLFRGMNEKTGSLDVSVRGDGQVSVALGTDADNPPTGTARMLIVRRSSAGATSTEVVDFRTLNLTLPPGGFGEHAAYRGEIAELSDGRQLLAYRLELSGNSGTSSRTLHVGPRDGSGGPAPTQLEVDIGPVFGEKEHGIVVDEAGRPVVWWRRAVARHLRANRGTTAGVFSLAGNEVLNSATTAAVAAASFGDGRTGILYIEGGALWARRSESGAAFGAPELVATPAAVPPSLTGVALAGAGEGSAVAVWQDGASFMTSKVHATPFDATPPTLPAVQTPASLFAGIAGTFTATAADDWSATSVTWLFGDGVVLNGLSVDRAVPAVGPLAVTARATDAAGNTATEDRTVQVTRAPDTRAPVLRGVRLVPATLVAPRRATTLRFTIDEPATVVAALQRARPGFRSGNRCVAVRPRRGTVRPCTRWLPAGTARRTVAAGAVALTIRRPRLSGRYRVAVSAVDVAGNRSPVQRRILTVRARGR